MIHRQYDQKQTGIEDLDSTHEPFIVIVRGSTVQNFA